MVIDSTSRTMDTLLVFNGKILGYNIKSSGFTVSGISGTVYLGDVPNSDQETGSVFLFKLNSPTEPLIVKRNVGTIDYKKGEIKLNQSKYSLHQLIRISQPLRYLQFLILTTLLVSKTFTYS